MGFRASKVINRYKYACLFGIVWNMKTHMNLNFMEEYKMECLRCKEKMFNAKLKGDMVGTMVYLTNKKKGALETEKNSSISCYVCPKCGYIELNADNAKNLIL